MKKIVLISVILCISIFTLSACGEKSVPITDEPATEVSWDVIEAAYNYSLPLLVVDATKKKITNTVEVSSSQAPINQFVHSQGLATAESFNVVTPNTDTLYSQVFFDLSDSPMVLSKPKTDRFATIQLMDAYTNTVALLGTGGDPQEARSYLLTGPDYQGEIPAELVQVAMPQNMGWIIGRILCEGVDDLENVYAIQKQYQFMPLDAYLAGEDFTPPAGVYNEEFDFVPVNYVMAMTPQEYFDTANRLLADNPPAELDQEIMGLMESLNVGPNKIFDPSLLGPDGEEKWKNMIGNLGKTLSAENKAFTVKMNQWTYLGQPISKFGKEYSYRALVALGGLGANPVDAAIYPRVDTDDEGQILNGSQSYIIHFEKDGLPPTEDQGFWSITAYNSANFLIDNPLNRYSINDRSELNFNEDGSLDIIVSKDPPSDAAMENNWLPVSQDDFHLYLRIYLPKESVLNNDWMAPTIKKKLEI